jgi:hypothetical protein
MPMVTPCLLAVAAVALAAGGCTHTSTPEPPASTAPASPPKPIVINAEVGEILTPTAAAHARLTAEQAWVSYTRRVGHPQSRVPDRLRVVLGRLTLPPQFSGRLVWAYGYGPTGCITTLPQATPPVGVEWTFVDADTGKMVEETCQPPKAATR